MDVLVTGAKQSGEFGQVWGYTLNPGTSGLRASSTPTLRSVRWRTTGALASDYARLLATKTQKIFADKDPENFYQVEEVAAESGLLAKRLADLRARALQTTRKLTYREVSPHGLSVTRAVASYESAPGV